MSWQEIRHGLESRWVRGGLALAIVVSLLPYSALEVQLRPLLLMLFGGEFLLRLALVIRRQVDNPREEMGFLVVDFLALLSFLPADSLGISLSVLRALRLLRLVVLLRFTRELARDIYRVLTRREQLRQLAFVTGSVLGLSFVAAVVLHSMGWPEPTSEEGFWDRMWWAFRQVESPDNLVPTLRDHPGLILVSLGLTIVGIFVFSYLIGLGTTIVEQVLQAEKRRAVPYHGHTLIAGPVHGSASMVEEFVRIYEKNRELRRLRPREIWRWLRGLDPRPRRHALPRITLLGAREELPAFLYKPHMRRVVYRQGSAADAASLSLAGGEAAKRAVFLPDGDGDDADAKTVAALSTFRAHNRAAHVFLEVRRSENAAIAKAVGGPSTFVLDGPRFIGLFLAHHLTIPGAERVFAELMSADGNEMYTHLYADEGERQALHAGGEDFSFAEMARQAHEQHGVTLVGAFVGDEQADRGQRRLLSMSHLTVWLNPLVAPQGVDLQPFALETNTLPAAKLQGLIGLAPTYLPLRRAARAATTPVDVPVADADAAGQLFGQAKVQDGPANVLIVGHNEALEPLVDSLGHLRESIRIQVALPMAADVQLPEGLARGGRCESTRSEALASCAASLAQKEGAEAVVFMAPRAEADPDAILALRVHRFVREWMGGSEGSKETPLQLLVEVDALPRGETLAQDVARLTGGQIRVTPVSTSEITNYFLVHSVFVAGVMELYEQLLGTRGDDLMYVPVGQGQMPQGEVDARSLRDVLMAQGFVLLGLRHHDGGVCLNPPADQRFDAESLDGAFVVGRCVLPAATDKAQ